MQRRKKIKMRKEEKKLHICTNDVVTLAFLIKSFFSVVVYLQIQTVHYITATLVANICIAKNTNNFFSSLHSLCIECVQTL